MHPETKKENAPRIFSVAPRNKNRILGAKLSAAKFQHFAPKKKENAPRCKMHLGAYGINPPRPHAASSAYLRHRGGYGWHMASVRMCPHIGAIVRSMGRSCHGLQCCMRRSCRGAVPCRSAERESHPPRLRRYGSTLSGRTGLLMQHRATDGTFAAAAMKRASCTMEAVQTQQNHARRSWVTLHVHRTYRTVTGNVRDECMCATRPIHMCQ